MLPLRLHWFLYKVFRHCGGIGEWFDGYEFNTLHITVFVIFEQKILTLAVGCSESIPG